MLQRRWAKRWSTLCRVRSEVEVRGMDGGDKGLHVGRPGIGSGFDCKDVDGAVMFMLLDVKDQSSGVIHLWGSSPQHGLMLIKVHGYCPYFYTACPVVAEGREIHVFENNKQPELCLDGLMEKLNRFLEADRQVIDSRIVWRKPIMFYRPHQMEGAWFLKLSMAMGHATKTAAATIEKVMKQDLLQEEGFHWDDQTIYEENIKLLTRFMADTSISGSSWVLLEDYEIVMPQDRQSSCNLELTCSWTAVTSITPDILQLSHHDPPPLTEVMGMSAEAQSTLQIAHAGGIPSLKCVALMVMMVPSISTADAWESHNQPVCADKNSVMGIACDAFVYGNEDVHHRVLFAWGIKPAEKAAASVQFPVLNAEVLWFGDERSMLLSWRNWVSTEDPDIFLVFDVKDSLVAIQERFQRLGLDGGVLRLSRLLPRFDNGVSKKNVVMYSTAWVKSQARMSATSNQETWRAEMEGRIVFDILRHCLTALKLASFSLMDCAHSVLSERIEVLSPVSLKQIWISCCEGDRKELFRLGGYCFRHVSIIQRLANNLGVITEAIEMARVTGLTLTQVMYNAQMIRTWSLLIRHAHRESYIVGGRVSPASLSESPYLMHPIQQKVAGLYKDPVAVLDFTSLYPSIYCAYNMCYSTLVHPEDVKMVGIGNVTISPTGAAFVKSDFRKGLLPSLLRALMKGRAQTRDAMQQSQDTIERLILDGRQKALKIVANAMYGFTGSQASPLQCIPLADSCLALGAATCKRAQEIIEDLGAIGALGSKAIHIRVIYAQTDSLFVFVPYASVAESIDIGHQASRAVSEAFPPEIHLKFENVLCPFMLLHVNRYAGCAFSNMQDVSEGNGSLIVKGLKSLWRQASPFVQSTLHGAIERIIMENDVASAVEFVKENVKQLLSGERGIWELTMTGGLWRVTGSQIETAASAYARQGMEDEVRGPHASLAVRIQQKFPDKKFILGERIQYVLLSGHRTQDEAAEDPLKALYANLQPDYGLYWKNKLMRPISEIFATCLDKSQLQALLTGPHTLYHVSKSSNVIEKRVKGQLQKPPGKQQKQTGLTEFFMHSPKCLGCKCPMEGLPNDASSPAKRPHISIRQEHLEGSTKVGSTPKSSRTVDGPQIPHTPAANLPNKSHVKCEDHGRDQPYDIQSPVNSRRFNRPVLTTKKTQQQPGASVQTPGLCLACASDEGKWEDVLLRHLEASQESVHRYGRAVSQCIRCHSNGTRGSILCENAECPLLYERIEQGRRMVEELDVLDGLSWNW